jgi:NAD+--dinitrogen-reductase ADP-D-ribosyltransferase
VAFGEGGGHGANLVGIPAGLLGSAVFNDYPRPVHIAGVREQHHDFFARLAAEPNAAAAFDHYMETSFQLANQGDAPNVVRPRRFRANYRRLLRGWGFDANSREGAVLKAWVENRFGLFPTFHKEPLTRVSSPAWGNYVEEKMSSRFHNNNILLQLDLLYEFCQWVLARRRIPGRHIILYRGVNDFIEHPLIRKNRGREIIVRLNNLVSFTADRSVACEFGDTILEVRVPKVKIVFFSELLPRHPLKGEAEYLVIGGDYRVTASYL